MQKTSMCNVTTCTSPYDQHHLWNCLGNCGRSFHAACIGTKRGSEDDLRLHLTPICIQCRTHFHMEVDVRKILQHLLESSHSILTHIKTNDKTNQEALNELHNKTLSLQEDMKKSAENAKKIYTAIVTQPPASDISLAEVKKAINETTAHQNLKLAESFGRIQEITSSHRDDIIKTITSAEKCPSDIILAVHDEVRALTSSINNSHEADIEGHQKTLADELHENAEIESAELQPGWRIIGSKKIWKPDWTDFDRKQQARRLQEKEADKARRRKRNHRHQIQQQQQQQKIHQHNHRQQQHQHPQHTQQQTNCNSDTGRNRPRTPHFNLNDNRNNNNDNGSSSNLTSLPFKLSDKQLLNKARVEFSGHQPAASTSNFINFQKGETINPYQSEKIPIVPPVNVTTSQSTPPTKNPELTDSMFCLDPMKPPIVRLTEQSACGDGKFLLARLNEPHVYQNLRMYLAFLKDQPLTYCTADGITLTSMKAYLYSQGLPKSDEQLLNTLLEYHSTIGLPASHTHADLEACRKYMSSKKIQHLQRTREDTDNFFRPSNFRKY